jgi:hypothetical protein
MASAQDKIKAQENDIENDEIDATAEKAKDIGKELEVKDGLDGKEALPDYEVIEEDDKPLAKERDTKQERKQLTNKEKRDLRKKRVQEKFQQKDAIIENSNHRLINLLVDSMNLKDDFPMLTVLKLMRC